MKLTCKKCTTPFEGKFCPECGTKYIVTMEERIEDIEKRISQLENIKPQAKVIEKVIINPSIHKPTKTESMSAKPKKVYKMTERNEKDYDRMMDYVRNNDGIFAISKLYRLTTGKSIDGQASAYAHHKLEERKPYNIQIIRRGKVIRLAREGGNEYSDKNPLPSRPEQATRMKEIAGYTTDIMKQQGYNHTEALRLAHKKYKEIHKSEEESKSEALSYMIREKPMLPPTGIPGTIVEKRFPFIDGLNSKYLPILRDMLNNVVNNKSEFSYVDAECLEITSGTEFFKLMSGIAFKLNEISAYFGVDMGKFKFVGDLKNRKLVFQ